MSNNRTISPTEMTRFNNLDVKNLHYYQGLFQKILIGRNADIEFYELQEKNRSGYVFDRNFKNQLLKQIDFFQERLTVINSKLDSLGLNQLETSIN